MFSLSLLGREQLVFGEKGIGLVGFISAAIIPLGREVSTAVVRAYNDFLELATGYDAKQRSKRAQAEAKKGADADVPDDV